MIINQKEPGIFELKTKDASAQISSTTTIGEFVISGPGEYEVQGIMADVTSVATRFLIDDLVFVYLHPRQTRLRDQELEEIGAADVLLFPLGNDSLNIDDALATLAQIEAPIMIPIARDEAILEELCTKKTTCERQIGPLKLTKSQLPTEGSRIIVF